MLTVLATAIAFLPLFFLLVATGVTADWAGMWLYYLAVPAVPVIAGLEKVNS